MANMRSHWKFLTAALTLASVSTPSWAQSASWEVVAQPGGYKVARVAMSGGASGLGFTCERNVPVIAVNLAQTPRRNPAVLSLGVDGHPSNLTILRNGVTNVWVTSVKNPRLLDDLAGADAATVAVDGQPYGIASLRGAGAALRTALAGCWRPAGSAPVSNAVAAAVPAPGGLTDTPMAAPDTSSPATQQTSFPLRDPLTGKARLPVRLGAYVPKGRPCSKPQTDAIFIDSGDGAHFGAWFPGESRILTIRQVKPGTYATREEIDIQDTATANFTYVVTDPEHFTISGPEMVENGKQAYDFCSQTSLPIAERNFLKSEHRTLPVLPVPPGYYEFWASDETPPKPTCAEYCGYLLISERGIAEASMYAFDTGKEGKVQRQTLVKPTITQSAPLHYFVKGSAEFPYYAITMTETGSFEIDADGEGATLHLRRADPAKIPARMKPAF